MIDWFYTADRLEQGGIMLIDDGQLKSVRILVEFMNVNPAWSILESYEDKTFAFRKERRSIHDVAWHMQPFNFESQSDAKSVRTLWRKLIACLKGREL